jgi:hypothetical protein
MFDLIGGLESGTAGYGFVDGGLEEPIAFGFVAVMSGLARGADGESRTGLRRGSVTV